MINDSVFVQAVSEAFPQLEDSLKQEILNNVSSHMMEFLKEKVFENLSEDLAVLDAELQNIQDVGERSKVYGSKIFQKLSSLDALTQDKILRAFDEELTKVMHEVYNAVYQEQ